MSQVKNHHFTSGGNGISNLFTEKGVPSQLGEEKGNGKNQKPVLTRNVDRQKLTKHHM